MGGKTVMSMREKILVGLMIVAVAIGALSLMSDRSGPRPAGDSGNAPQPLTQMLTKLTARFEKGTSLENSRYTFAMAQSPWEGTLFLEDEGMLTAAGRTPGAAETLPANLSLIYSGYVETPRHRVAIINGIEYVVGDRLDQSSYTLRQITPQQVLIDAPQQQMLALPLVEGWEAQTP